MGARIPLVTLQSKVKAECNFLFSLEKKLYLIHTSFIRNGLLTNFMCHDITHANTIASSLILWRDVYRLMAITRGFCHKKCKNFRPCPLVKAWHGRETTVVIFASEIEWLTTVHQAMLSAGYNILLSGKSKIRIKNQTHRKMKLTWRL